MLQPVLPPKLQAMDEEGSNGDLLEEPKAAYSNPDIPFWWLLLPLYHQHGRVIGLFYMADVQELEMCWFIGGS